MKNFLKIFLYILLLISIPSFVFATSAATWTITNLTDPFIFPNTGNGTKGIVVSASSTIGNGNQNGGLTINGGATTTGNAYFGSGIFGAGLVGCASAGKAVSWNSATGLFNCNSGYLTTDPNWLETGSPAYLTPTTTIGYIVNATSTIGDGTQTGGLTISGGATTTGNAYFAGKVGVGTTSPVATLGMAGSIGVNASQLVVAANGNVGIGSTTPNAPLYVYNKGNANNSVFTIDGVGSGGANINQMRNSNASYQALTTYRTGTTLDWSVGEFNDSTSNFYFAVGAATAPNTALTITAGKNVGIGTTSPFAKLSVQANSGDTNTILFAIASSTQTATTTLLSTTNGGQTSTCEAVPATSTSMTINFQNTCNQVLLQIGTAATTITFTNAKVGDTKRLVIVNPNASAGAITFSGIVWLGGTAYTQTTTANSGDIISCFATQATSTVATSPKIECAPSTGLQ